MVAQAVTDPRRLDRRLRPQARPARKAAKIGPIEAADIMLGVGLAKAKDRPAMQAAGIASEIGAWQALLAVSAGTLAYGLLVRDRRLAETGGRMLGAGILASLVKTSVKRLVHRTRPNVLMDTGIYARGRLGPNVGPWQSFPSGHSALSAAVACAVARSYPELRGPAYAMAGGVTIMQVLRGAHYPSDVFVGSLIGIAAEATLARAIGEPAVPQDP